MAKFTHNGHIYRPRCISCNSTNVTLVKTAKGYRFRCNKCKSKSRLFENLDDLLKNPGMFSPGLTCSVKIDETLRETHKAETGRLTNEDLQFLEELKAARKDLRPTAIWTLREEAYTPCWEELAEAWELYDPQTHRQLAYIPEPLADIGKLKCIPVRKTSKPVASSLFIAPREANDFADSYGDGVCVAEGLLGEDDMLSKLMGIVSKIDWKSMMNA